MFLKDFFFLMWTFFFKVFIEFVIILPLFFLMFQIFYLKACGILAPQPGIDPTPPTLESEVLTSGLPWKSLAYIFDVF